MDQTRVTSSCEFPELGDQTNVALRDWLVWVGTDDTARNGTTETDAGAESIDCDAVSDCDRDR